MSLSRLSDGADSGGGQGSYGDEGKRSGEDSSYNEGARRSSHPGHRFAHLNVIIFLELRALLGGFL